jgi:hypothetical protein
MDRDDLLAIRNFGPRSFNELWDKLKEHNFLPADAESVGEDGELADGDEFLLADTDDDDQE